MAKPTLGRGLGDLLGGNREGSGPGAPVRPPGVGLRILIKGAPGGTESAAPGGAEVSPDRGAAVAHASPVAVVAPSVPATTVSTSGKGGHAPAALVLLMADVGLLGWAVAHAVTRAHGFRTIDILACVGSVALAMLCGCMAVRLLGEDEP